jgi:5'(3')-deoxyribonucleotidase
MAEAMRIGLDLDGVCYQWSATAQYMLRERMLARGETPPVELFQEPEYWDWIEDYTSPEDWSWLWSGAIEEGLYRYGHVVKGAIEGAQAISKLGETTVITARPKAAVHDTMAWLELMFNRVPLAGVVIQSDGQKKSEVPGIDVYIDDAKHNLEELLDNTEAAVIQFVQPWNEDFEPRDTFSATRLFRAYNWREVVTQIEWLKEGCF